MTAANGVLALRSLLDHESRKSDARGFRLAHHLFLMIGVGNAVIDTLRQQPMSQALMTGIALLVGAFFMAEWLARLAMAPAKVNYLVSFLGLIDLAGAWCIPLAVAAGLTAEEVSIAGMVWTLKSIRHVPGFALIGRVLHNELGTLLSVLAAFAMAMLLASTAVYVLEREMQPNSFGSLPAALWWCVVTLTTTGYGDAVPVTALGRIIAGMVMILGIAILAMLAGILASGFAAEIRRRDFLQNWNMVASVPLFKSQGAAVIAEVARRLRPRRLAAGAVLVRKGDPGDCMYFIVEGEVEVAVRPQPVRLGVGAFLGEMALISGAPRNATVTTRAPTQLLILDIADFRELAGKHPEMTCAIEAEAARRHPGEM